MIISISIHVVAIVYIYTACCFICSSLEVCLGCFQALAIVKYCFEHWDVGIFTN